jgi:hypothetical protein
MTIAGRTMDISILLKAAPFPFGREAMDWGLEWYERSADSVSPYTQHKH